MAKNEKGLLYQFKVDEDVAEMYANEGCKHCLGRGTIRSHTGVGGTIRRGVPMVEHVNYCNCVRKNQKKYG